jgi:hypothetical protein
MKRKCKGIQNLLFMAISISLLVFPTFQDCEDLIDIGLLSSEPTFEKACLEGVASGRQGNGQALELNTSLIMLLLAANPFKLVPPDSSSILSTNQHASILRC